MTSNLKTLLFTAAVSGLLTGTAVCAHAATAAEGASGAANAYASQTATSSSTFLNIGFKADRHTCKGMNSCKGKGGCESSDNGCRGKNSCKGKGGCSTMGPAKKSTTPPPSMF